MSEPNSITVDSVDGPKKRLIVKSEGNEMIIGINAPTTFLGIRLSLECTALIAGYLYGHVAKCSREEE